MLVITRQANTTEVVGPYLITSGEFLSLIKAQCLLLQNDAFHIDFKLLLSKDVTISTVFIIVQG